MSRWSRRFSHLIAALPLALVSCGAMPTTTEGEIAAGKSPLYEGAGVVLWTQNNNYVPVCWEMTPLTPSSFGDVNSAQFATWRQQIHDSVVSGWEAATGVRFGGWSACPNTGTAQFVRLMIVLSTGEGGASTRSLGMSVLVPPPDGTTVCSGSPLIYCPGPSVIFGIGPTTSLGRIQYMARHELGHVLGFDHEQNSPLNSSTCPRDVGSSQAGITLTSYDPNSIMNYCEAAGNASGALTQMDIQGARTAYRIPLNDYDQNGAADILWHNGISGVTTIWSMNGTTMLASTDLDASLNTTDATNWRAVGQNDFNLDGKPDILWHNGVSGASQVWYMNDQTRIGFDALPAELNTTDSSGWRIIGVADLNQDGKPDILGHNGTTGVTQVWYMDGVARTSFANLDPSLNFTDGTGWSFVGAGDFNRDGNPDLVWHNGTSGATQVWYMNGIVRSGLANFDASLNTADSTGWRMVATDDFNADGYPDILAHNGATGASQIWFLNNVTRSSYQDFASWMNIADSTGWTVVRH